MAGVKSARTLRPKLAAQMAAYATRHFSRDTKAALRMPAMFSCKFLATPLAKVVSGRWSITNQPTNQSINRYSDGTRSQCHATDVSVLRVRAGMKWITEMRQLRYPRHSWVRKHHYSDIWWQTARNRRTRPATPINRLSRTILWFREY